MSLEPHELADFVKQVRAVEAAIGDPRIIFNSRVKAEHRRSVILRRAVKAGQVITLEDLDYRRPGTHIPADRYEEVVGHKAKRDLAIGEFPQFGDVE